LNTALKDKGKIWAVFAVLRRCIPATCVIEMVAHDPIVGTAASVAEEDPPTEELIVEPAAITQLLTQGGTLALPAGVVVLPWQTPIITCPLPTSRPVVATTMSNTTPVVSSALQAAVTRINALVKAIDQEDPWVKAAYGCSGCGEGVVMYPIHIADAPGPTPAAVAGYQDGASSLALGAFSRYAFKAKGLRHQVVSLKNGDAIAALISAASPQRFVGMLLTDARLEQAFNEVRQLSRADGTAISTPTEVEFLAHITADIRLEGEVELASSKLTWQDVAKLVQAATLKWFREKATGSSRAHSSRSMGGCRRGRRHWKRGLHCKSAKTKSLEEGKKPD